MTASAERREIYDVAVVGGGSAGVAAAVAAATLGARVVLIERYGETLVEFLKTRRVPDAR